MNDAPSNATPPSASPENASSSTPPPSDSPAPSSSGLAERSERNRVIGLAALTLVMFGFYFWEHSSGSVTFAYPVADGQVYNTAARAIAAGAALPPTALDQPPLYVYFLAAIHKISGGNVLAAKCVHAILGMLTCLLTWSLARKLFDPVVASVAAALTIYWGPLLFFSSELVPTALVVFLSTLSLWLLVRAMGQHAWWAWGVAGLSFGLAALASPIILWFVLAVALGLVIGAIVQRSPARLAGAGLILLGVALMIAPVMIRNAQTFNRFALVPQGSGLHLHVGNNPDAFETIATRPGSAWNGLASEPVLHGAYTLGERDRYFYGKVAEYVRTQPGDFVKGLFRKTRLFLAARETPLHTDMYALGSPSSLFRWLTLQIGPIWLPFGLFAPFALLGIVVAWRQSRSARVLTGYLVVSGASVILFYMATPYRLPIVPVLAIFAAFALVWLREQLGKGNTRAIAGGLALVLATGVVVNWPVRAPADHVNFRTEMLVDIASQAIHGNQPDLAKQILEQALEQDEDSAEAHCLLGRLLAGDGQRTAALDHFNKALSIDPDLAEAHHALALIAVQEERWSDAEQCFRDLLKTKPLAHNARLKLVGTLLRQQKPNEAVQALSKGIELIPVYSPYRRELVRVLQQAGDQEAAKAELESAVAAIPSDPLLHYLLGRALVGHPDTALRGLEHLETAVALDPGNLIYRLDLAGALFATGRMPAARQAINGARQVAQQKGEGVELVDQAEARLLQVATRMATQTAPATSINRSTTMPSSRPSPGSPTRGTE